MTNQEINEAIARKLGWNGPDKYGLFIDPKAPAGFIAQPCPNYCGSITAAWEMTKGQYVRMVGNDHGWFCTFSPEEGYEARANTAPMAVCLAFLKLGDKA